MTMAFVQQGDARNAAGLSIDVTLTSVGAGNMVVMNCLRIGATNRDLSTQDVTNTVSGTVAVAELVSALGGTNLEVAIDYIPSAVGGNTTYRLTASGSTDIELDCFEFSHDGTATFDAGGSADNATGTSHVCASSGQIDTAAGAMVVMCTKISSSTGVTTGPSGFTMSTLAGTGARSGYKGPGTYTNENAAHTTTNSRYSVGAVASFAEVGGGPTGHPAVKRMGGIPYMARNRGVW